jgi:L-fuculose-phosphate aldolase
VKGGETVDIRKKMAETGKKLHEKGLAIGSGGNISVREEDDLVIKKRGTDMSRENPDDYIVIPLAKALVPNEDLSTETPFHVACYEAREEIGSVIHVHSPETVAASEKTGVLENVSYEFNYVLESPVPVIEFIQPGSTKLAEEIGRRIKGGANAVLMRRHGAIAVGRDIEEAYVRILALNRACKTFLYLH